MSQEKTWYQRKSLSCRMFCCFHTEVYGSGNFTNLKGATNAIKSITEHRGPQE
ncbi:hypothetical protein LEMLEM_LOCUS6470 [Lemmus lemmus]